MKIVDNFFNKLAEDLGQKYFPAVKYYGDDKKCSKVHYNIELFNNGCLKYEKLIKNLSKYCNDSEENIQTIVNKYIIM